MPSSDEKDDKSPPDQQGESEVGYRRPPKHARFKKGCSGNPRGRPKGSRRLADELAAILQKRIAVRDGRKPMRAQEILIQNLLASALKNDPKAVAQLFKIAEKCGQLVPEQPAALPRQLTRNDQQLIKDFVERVRQADEEVSDVTDIDPKKDQ